MRAPLGLVAVAVIVVLAFALLVALAAAAIPVFAPAVEVTPTVPPEVRSTCPRLLPGCR